jgi:DedD protein
MGRFVIQLGAFTDEAKIRALRAKVERMGLKTYTQQVGKADVRQTRVRIGPYSSRQDAEQTVSKLKAQGLTAVVLTL